MRKNSCSSHLALSSKGRVTINIAKALCIPGNVDAEEVLGITGFFVSPDALRTYCLPWQRRLAGMAHAKGLPYFLHSCGNLREIMEDLIEDVGIDGKHSFENAIIPAVDFQAKYGERIAVLGGLDINILTRETPQNVRKETCRLMDLCGDRGRYAVGSGNSVPSYIPVANYLAMVEEAVTRRGLS